MPNFLPWHAHIYVLADAITSTNAIASAKSELERNGDKVRRNLAIERARAPLNGRKKERMRRGEREREKERARERRSKEKYTHTHTHRASGTYYRI